MVSSEDAMGFESDGKRVKLDDIVVNLIRNELPILDRGSTDR